jgi:hypothetical protein
LSATAIEPQTAAETETEQTEVQAGIEKLFQPGQVVEIRIPGKYGTSSGYFNNAVALAAALDKENGKHPAIYYTLNPCAEYLLARANNTLAPKAKSTTNGKDIVSRRWLFLDFDPVRAEGISSTDAEKSLALAKAQKVHTYLSKQGWPAPVSADSGNGYHLLYRVALPNTDATTNAVKAFVNHVADKFDDDVIKIDRKVFDPNRIIKAYGTLACKGADMPDRPHRYSCLRSIAGGKECVTLEQLTTLAPVKVTPAKTAKKESGVYIGDEKVGGSSSSQYESQPIPVEKMEEFMAAYDIERADPVTLPDGRVKWTVTCPFNPEHNHKDAAIFLTDGKPGFICFHNSCAENNWKTLRAKLETEHDKKFYFFQVNAKQAVPADAETENEMVLEWATEIKPEVMQWLWPNRIPFGKLTLFVGHPDVGKGMATMDIAARASKGTEWPDCKNTNAPIKSIILSSEDAAGDTLIPRLMAAKADLSKIAIQRIIKLKNGEEKPFSLDKDLPTLRKKLQMYPDIKLVVIDPLFNHLGTVKGNVEQEMRAVLTPLAKLAEQHKVAIILVTHFNKNIAAEAIQRVGGAQAVVGSVRVAWLFAKSKEDEEQRSMIALKANITKSGGSGLDYDTESVDVKIGDETVSVGHITWGDTTHQTATNAMSADPNNGGTTKASQAKTWLKKFLASGESVSSTHVVAAAELDGFSQRTIMRVRKELGTEIVVSRPVNPGPWYWRYAPHDGFDEVDDVKEDA